MPCHLFSSPGLARHGVRLFLAGVGVTRCDPQVVTENTREVREEKLLGLSSSPWPPLRGHSAACARPRSPLQAALLNGRLPVSKPRGSRPRAFPGTPVASSASGHVSSKTVPVNKQGPWCPQDRLKLEAGEGRAQRLPGRCGKHPCAPAGPDPGGFQYKASGE